MTGKELLDKLLADLLRIGPTPKNLELYQETKASLNDFQLVDFFHQLKKNDRGGGLALEIMMFDRNILHDIVFTRTTIDHISVVGKSIGTIYIQASVEETKNDKGEITLVDNLSLNISVSGEVGSLGYKTETKKFTELNRIKANLLKTITQ